MYTNSLMVFFLRKKITPDLAFLELLSGFNVLLDLFFTRKHGTWCMEQICTDNIFIQSWPWSCSMIRQKASWFPDVACRNLVSSTDSQSTALFSTFFSIELPTKAPLFCLCENSEFSVHPQSRDEWQISKFNCYQVSRLQLCPLPWGSLKFLKCSQMVLIQKISPFSFRGTFLIL